MKFYEAATINEGKVSGIRINFLWVFNFTLLHNTARGNHVNVAIGITPFEISLQFSIWEFSYAKY